MINNLKILTWNCNGAFRRKFGYIDPMDADIMVIQECEDPSKCKDEKYREWAVNYIWIGENKNKGLAIFCKEHIKISINIWEDDNTKYFISAKINDRFNLVAVWNQNNKSVTYRYIGQFWKYLQINKGKLNDCIILGDFNSNKIWDQNHRLCNHSVVVSELKEIGISSLYHENYNIEQGVESHPTFYMQRNLKKPYHIDYIFVSNSVIQIIKSFEIGSSFDWLKISDHLPILLDFDLKPFTGL